MFDVEDENGSTTILDLKKHVVNFKIRAPSVDLETEWKLFKINYKFYFHVVFEIMRII